MKTSSTASVRTFTYIALMTAILCILGPIAIPIPFSPVPITLASLGLYLSTYIMSKKNACLSCILYLTIGLAGIPVLSGFSGGIGKLFGPTGGYILAYLPLVLISSFFVSHFQSKTLHITGFLLGTIVLYCLGSIWLSYTANLNLGTAFIMGAIPYIPGDIIKIGLTIYIGPRLQVQLSKTRSHI